MRRMVLAILLLVAFAPQALAQDATLTGKLQLRSHYETIAVQLSYQGDINWNNSGQIEYRQEGSKEWKLAHPLSRIAGNRLAGSIFGLKPNTSYEIRITVMDPDGVREPVILDKIATRSDQFPCGSGKTFYVSTHGDDAADGSKERPFKSIQKAQDTAGPGDIVIVKPGIYREAVHITKSGTADAYILYKAAGKGVILDGSDAGIAKDPRVRGWGWIGDDWKPVGDNIYVYARPAPANLSDVAFVDDKRLVSYGTLEELKTLPANTNKESTSGYYGKSLGGYYLDRQAKKAYLRTRDDSDPDEHIVNISSEERPGIYIDGAKYIIIDGFEGRYFGSTFRHPPIRINNAADYCVIQNCILHGSVMGVAVDKSQYITFQDNLVYDNMPYALDWKGAYRGRYAHTQGVSFEGAYENQVIRRNKVVGFVDGIVLSDGAGHRYENYDIYENEITESRDDALELDCDDINVKVWGNRIYENHSAISVSGCDVGPLYIFRNLIYRYFNESYKLHARAKSGPIYLYNNTMVSLWPSEGTEVGRGMEISFRSGMSIVADQYLTMKNNIFVGATWARVDEDAPRSPGYVVEDYNCWFTTHKSLFFNINRKQYNTLAEFQRATGKEKNSISAEPRFVSIKEGNFRLAEGSPCIDAGTPIPNIAESFHGSRPDLGTYESKVGPPQSAKFKRIDASEVPPAVGIEKEEPALPTAEPAEGAFCETDGKVLIEAEDFSQNIPRGGAAWKVEASQAGFSGTGYLAARPNAGVVWGEGSADQAQLRDAPLTNYRIYLNARGTYFVAVYMYGATSKDDSCHIGLDGECTTGYRVYAARQGRWHWADTIKEGRPVMLIVSTPGNHTLNLWPREDGVLVDKIILTKNPQDLP